MHEGIFGRMGLPLVSLDSKGGDSLAGTHQFATVPVRNRGAGSGQRRAEEPCAVTSGRKGKANRAGECCCSGLAGGTAREQQTEWGRPLLPNFGR